ncbi:antitoxin MazE-like protein [Nitrosospira briensis]|uniref:antitoxin MazE-like protein n=1 Tax=Nitrosospira briensis TaxID=35799 RepID=UPI000A63B57B
MHAFGLRSVQIWVPDTRRPGFAEECALSPACYASDSEEPQTSAWLFTIADIDDGSEAEAIQSQSR